MTSTKITKNEFYQAISNGLRNLVHHRQYLNEINVFPVADGDTGSNMASTAQTVLQQAQCGSSFKELLDNIANAAIRGARGNSGLILSDFFCEISKLSNAHNKSETISLNALGKLIYQAAQQTIKAIEKPVEGTIITVMRAWGRALTEGASKGVAASELFSLAQEQVERVLQQTTKELKALKGTRLVDAGAQGFVYLTKGISDFFCGVVTSFDLIDETTVELIEETHDYTEPPTLRYCTEGLVQGDVDTINELKAKLKLLGDSFVFAATNLTARFHIHTNEPWRVFEEAQALTSLTSPKVDDMLAEYRSIHARKSDIAIVTDSSADLPEDVLDKLHIYRIPINIQHGDEQFIDRVGMSTNLLYQLMADDKQYPTTSLPSAYQIEKVISSLAKHYKHVLVITLSKKLSGTFKAVSRIASRFDSVTMFDSLSYAGGHGLQVYYAAKLIEKGLALPAIIERLKEARAHSRSFVYIDRMDALKRSGRISHMKAFIARISNIKTIIGVNREGTIDVVDKSFTTSGAKFKFMQKIKALVAEGLVKDYAILHVNSFEKAKLFAKEVEAIVGFPPLLIQSASPSASLHAGFGALSFASIAY